MPVLSSFSKIKFARIFLGVNFNLIVTDQNCQFYLYCHISKLSVLSLLLRLIKASLIILVPDKNAIIVTDQNCLLSLLLRLKKASLSIVFPVKKYQFYLHYQRSKLPLLSLLSEIIITSFILIVVVEKSQSYYYWPFLKKCQFNPHCHRSKLPVLSLLLQIKIDSFIHIVTYQNCQYYPYCHHSKLAILS